jgi:hypothetical protein
MKLDVATFVKVKEPARDGKFSFFGGWNLGGGVSLGIFPNLRITGREGKKLMLAKWGRGNCVNSSDGKITWEYFFQHRDAPLVYFTIYDFKGCISCGFGIHQELARALNKSYAEKLNRMLAHLVAFSLGG